jgi:hypothetical protein
MANKVIGFEIVIDGLGKTVETATELKRAIAQVNEEIKKTSDVQELKKLEGKLIDLKAAQMEVTKVTREQIKTRNEEITGIDKANGAYRKLSKELNDQRNRYKDLAAAQQDNTQEARDLLVSINALDKRLKGIDATVGQFQRNVGGYTEALSNFFPKLGGTLGQVTGAIGGLSMGITQLGKTTGAANISLGAIGIALTAFSAIGEIFATVNQTVEETRKLSAQVHNFTQATGSTLQDFVSQSKAIATTYSKDVNEIIVAANTASKELGVTFPEALNLIEVGFRKGADAQGEFLDGLREYPAQFRDAGLSAQDFIKVSIAAANEGIYSDKGLDVVKEFSLRIREQTKASRDALENAFGKQFTNDLFNNLNNGSITAGQALTQVTGKINETGIAGSELQTVIADVFGGPGEDVGQRFLTTLGEILNTTEDITESSTEYQTQQEQIYQSNLDLEESQAALNEMLVKTSGEFTIINNASKTFFNNVLLGLVELVNQFPATFKAMSIGFQTFFATGNLKVALDANRIVFRNEIDKINKEDEIALKNAEKQRKALEEQLAKEKLQREKERRNKERNISEKGGEESAKAFVEGSLAKLQEEQSKLQKAFSEAVVGSGTQKEIGIKLNVINNQIKDAVEQQNQIIADAARGNLLKNLQNAKPLTTLPVPTKPLQSIKQSDIAKKDAEDLKKVQEDIIKNSNEANLKRIENEKKAEQELYENRQKNIALAGEAAMALTNLFSTIQQAKLKKDADILNEEIRKTEENIALLEGKAERANGLKKKRLQKEIEAEKALLIEKNKQAEALQLKGAKEEKKIAIIQSIIQGALAVQRALSFPPGPPATIPSAIGTGVLSAIQTATIIAQPLAQGGVVTGERVNQKQNIPTRSNGDNVLAYVKRGEVVLNQRQQAMLGGSPTFRKIGIKGFAEGGIVPPISAPMSISQASSDVNNILAMLDSKTDAINSRIDRLQAYVVSDDIARDLAEGNKLRINATL